MFLSPLNMTAMNHMNSNAQVGGRRFIKQERYVQALMLNPKDANAWRHMGNSLRVRETKQIGNQTYTKAAMFRAGVDV